MPAYNFQKRFKPMIKSGRKPHTIRRKRKNQTKPGQILSLYVGMRTKQCELIGRAPCVKVLPVVIWPKENAIKVNGLMYSQKAALKLAKADGFDDLSSFFEFFERYEQDTLDDFELIEWDPSQLTV